MKRHAHVHVHVHVHVHATCTCNMCMSHIISNVHVRSSTPVEIYICFFLRGIYYFFKFSTFQSFVFVVEKNEFKSLSPCANCWFGRVEFSREKKSTALTNTAFLKLQQPHSVHLRDFLRLCAHMWSLCTPAPRGMNSLYIEAKDEV